MQTNTLVGAGSVGALAGLAGSVITILLAVSMLWALVLLVLKRISPKYQRSDLLVVVPALLFVFVTTGAAFFSWQDDQSATFILQRLGRLLPFLFFPLILPRFRTAEPSKLVDAFILGSSLCGILALPLALLQVGWYDIRAEGGAGNAIPFAMVSAFFGSISLLNVVHEARWRGALGLAGFLAAVICLLLSESRGLLPIPAVAVVAILIFYPEQLARLKNAKVLALLGGILAVIMLIAYSRMERLLLLVNSLFELQPDAQDNSTDLRLAMWEHAARLISEHPVLGYGIQNRRDLMAQIGLDYSHFHNGFLTTFVDSGAIGFAAVTLLIFAPLLCVLYNPSRVCWRPRLFIATMMASTYALGGMTNFIFLHDIYDSVFLWSALVVAMPFAGAGLREQELEKRIGA
jgi:O-antigen ligase